MKHLALLLMFVVAAPVSVSAQVTIPAGDSIQDAVNLNPAGTTYILGTGYHRITTGVTLKNDDIVEGVMGTIVSGARVLTGWTALDGRWYVTGQTQQGTADIPAGSCLPAYPRCNNPEDLFFDNIQKYHEDALADVGPGEYFFDYAADRIYVGDDPTSATVETSVTPRPFLHGGATGVTIRYLTIEKFAAPTGDGALGLWSGWLAFQNTIRWNHGGGIYQVTLSTATQNVVTYNCGMSMMGAGSGILVFQNEISYGNVMAGSAQTCGYDVLWGAGCSKWVSTQDLIVRGNYVHDCYGPGIWADIDNEDGLIEDNVVSFCRRSGIFWELSFAAVIRNNTLTQNGLDTIYGFYPTNGGIEVTAAANVEVYGNLLYDNYNGIMVMDDDRNGAMGEFNSVNVYIHNNLIDQRNIPGTSGYNGLMDFEDNTPTGPAFQPMANNRWANNTYCLGAGPLFFSWEGEDLTAVEWRAQGQDTAGNFACGVGPPVRLRLISVR